jgi:putative spermidine/putrescine transport system permease protein
MSAAVVIATPARAEVKRARSWGGALLLPLLPALIALVVFFIYPVAMLLVRSLEHGPGGITLYSYEYLFRQPVYVRILVNTVRISIEATAIALVLGYPLAYFLTRIPPGLAAFLAAIISVPYFTSALVRTYAWIVLLGTGGVVNQSLVALGIPGAPFQLMYSETGVLIGLSYILLPFMVLLLYSVMNGIDRRLLQAAASMGASPLRAFIRVYFPLTMPGVAAGCLLAFIQALGSYITPALMGSLRETMLATVIQQNIDKLDQWSLAAALAVMLLAFTALAFALFNRLIGLDRLFEAKW